MQVGSYYLSHGGVKNECPYAPCSNAGVGQNYAQGFAVKNKCPIKECPTTAPPGFEFATAGSCTLTKCTNGERGTYFTEGCKVAACTNGNSRSNPTRITHTHTHTHTHRLRLLSLG